MKYNLEHMRGDEDVNDEIDQAETSKERIKEGVELIFIDMPGSKVADVRCYFDTGFRDMKPEKYHVPHVLEHMLMESQVKGKTFQDRLTPLGADTNATTEYDDLWVFARIAAMHADTAVKEMLATVHGVDLNEELVEREKNVCKREAADQFDGLYPEVSMAMYAHALNDSIPGTFDSQLASIDSITLQDIKKYYKSFMASALTLVVTGNLTDEQKRRIRAMLKKEVVRKPVRSVKTLRLDTTPNIDTLPVMPTGALSLLNFVSKLEPVPEVRKAGCAESFMMAYLFNGPRTDAVKSLRERGLIYDVNFDTGKFGNLCDRTIAVTTEPARAREGIVAILDVLFSVLLIEETDKFKLEKSYAMNTMPLMCETVHDLANWYHYDIIGQRDLWGVGRQIEMLAGLTAHDIRNQMFQVLARSKWQFGMASEVGDKDFLYRLSDLNAQCLDAKNADECKRAYDAWRLSIHGLKQPKKSFINRLTTIASRRT